MAVAGGPSVVADIADFRETQPLQTSVSTSVKPIIDAVVICGGYGVCAMESDKGEIVAWSDADPYPS